MSIQIYGLWCRTHDPGWRCRHDNGLLQPHVAMGGCKGSQGPLAIPSPPVTIQVFHGRMPESGAQALGPPPGGWAQQASWAWCTISTAHAGRAAAKGPRPGSCRPIPTTWDQPRDLTRRIGNGGCRPRNGAHAGFTSQMGAAGALSRTQ